MGGADARELLQIKWEWMGCMKRSPERLGMHVWAAKAGRGPGTLCSPDPLHLHAPACMNLCVCARLHEPLPLHAPTCRPRTCPSSEPPQPADPRPALPWQGGARRPPACPKQAPASSRGLGRLRGL